MIYSFLGLTTLQIGVAVVGVIYISLGATVTVVNVSDFNIPSDTIPVNYIFMGIFIALLLVTGVCMILTAYYESQKFCLNSTLLAIAIIILFLVGSAVSFLNKPFKTKHVCVNTRCTESVWLSRLRYRTIDFFDEISDYDHSINVNPTPTEPTEPVEATETLSTTESTEPPEDTENSIIMESTENRTENQSATAKPANWLTKVKVVTKKNIIDKNEPVRYNLGFSNRTPFGHIQKNSGNGAGKFRGSVYPIVDREHPHKGPRNRTLDFRRKRFLFRKVRRNVYPMVDREHLHKEPRNRTLDSRRYGFLPRQNPEFVKEEVFHAYGEETFEETPSYIYRAPFFTAVLLFVLNLIFFLFTIVLLLSYKKQLKYIKLYVKNSSNIYLT